MAGELGLAELTSSSLPPAHAGGRGQLDSSRLPDDLCHRDVTISEARDFAGFRKWRRRRCWMLELQTNFFHNLDPISGAPSEKK